MFLCSFRKIGQTIEMRYKKRGKVVLVVEIILDSTIKKGQTKTSFEQMAKKRKKISYTILSVPQ